MLEPLRASNIPQPGGYTIKTYQQSNLQYGVAPIAEYLQIRLKAPTKNTSYAYTIPTDLMLVSFYTYNNNPIDVNIGFTNRIGTTTVLSLNALSTIVPAYGNSSVFNLPIVLLPETSNLAITCSENLSYLQVNFKICSIVELLPIN